MRRGFIFTVHSIAGLVAGLFILLISLSGSVLVFHEELDRLQYPIIISEGTTPVLAIDNCYNSLQRKFPHAQISNCTIAENSTQPFIFTIYDPAYKSGTEALQVFIHPQTA